MLFGECYSQDSSRDLDIYSVGQRKNTYRPYLLISVLIVLGH